MPLLETYVNRKMENLKTFLKIYDDLPKLDKIPPIINSDVESVRWGLDIIVRDLSDPEIQNNLSEADMRNFDRASELVEEIKRQIAETWCAEYKT